jgi:squalene-hopene/tetraprenyl-beta-curcumene cyclase
MMPSLQVTDSLLVSCGQAARKAVNFLISKQHSDGYWWADLTADSTLESDYILVELWRHSPETHQDANGIWNPPTKATIQKAVQSILKRQLPDGGFNIYAEGPSEISASVKAYTALKLAGVPVDNPNLTRLRERILAMGGLQATNSYVKINLSLFGLYPREHTPSIPPELMLLGKFIYQMSSWTRAIVIPLSIVHAANPQRPVPKGFHIDELLAPGVPLGFSNDEGFFSWRNFFMQADGALKLWERVGPKWIRRMAIKKAEAWTLEHTHHSDGVAAIYPPMMYVIMALDVLGYPPDSSHVKEAIDQFMNLLVDDERGFYFQPCFSPVWDSGIAAYALAESKLASESALTRCTDWLMSKEIRRRGDWGIKRPDVEPSGWAFEFANEFYPDIDDTAQVLLALAKSRGTPMRTKQSSNAL